MSKFILYNVGTTDVLRHENEDGTVIESWQKNKTPNWDQLLADNEIVNFDDTEQGVANAQGEACYHVDSLRRNKVNSPVEIHGTKFDADLEARENISGAVIRSMLDPSYKGEDWYDVENKPHSLTVEQIAAIGIAIAERKSQVVDAAQASKKAIRSMDNTTDIKAYQNQVSL